jgi:hypothetical protein
MLQTLARKPKTIAWFFVTLFYLQLVCIPVVARANARPLAHSTHLSHTNSWRGSTGGKLPFDNKEESTVTKKTTAGAKAIKSNSPAHVKGTVTTGPTQPEMQSFQSVNTNNLVDPFTGDFSYNIPLLDVGGYPVNLHYQSGISMDQEASWVGLGWNINPGVISRNMRGLPDDFKGEDKVENTTAIKDNRTLGITVGANAELLGATKLKQASNGDNVKGRAGVLGASLGIFHNTYKGWGSEFGVNANINAGSVAKGPLSGGLSVTNNSQDGLDISPSISYKLGKEKARSRGDITIGTNYNSRTGIQSLQITGQARRSWNDYKKQMGTGITAGLSFAKPSYTPTINVPYTTNAFSFTAKVGSEHWAFHPNFYIRGYGSRQYVDGDDQTNILPAYGYLYYDKAGKNRNVLLDFNREKDVPYTDNTPHIAVPIYTYDTWSVSGEGTGGMFRAYRGDIGYVFDHSLSTKSNSDKFSLDLGFGHIFHAGIDYNKVYATSKNNPWEGDNNVLGVIPFKLQDTTYENVYFKNPGEKTSVNKRYLQSIGNDSLLRIALYANGKNAPVTMSTRLATLFKGGRPVATRLFDQNTFRKERDKRTQVISYLTVDEAANVGLDKNIRSYNINSFPNGSCVTNYQELPRKDADRKAHHLSEISVLNADGRRYIYGIPVYNKQQTEVSMATGTGNSAAGLVKYDAGSDNSPSNNKGKDGYFNKEKMPAYSHSFLLSGILSSDYVDLTGDGITNDDYGDAVKFNYSQIYSTATPYVWRAPLSKDTAFYNEGLKTDNRDDRGSYTFGEREVWFLNSVESKTMIATFVLETDSIRQDSYGALDENGGINTNKRLYRLKRINLYTKADLLKNGIGSAKPIKSVHFEYSYELCKKNPGSLSGNGKLTLKKVWFSYNNNSKGKRNPYVFTYNGLNPDHNAKSVDRWGSYKNSSNNPGNSGGLSNADYSYVLQNGVNGWDSAKAAQNAAPWTLSEIKLPSGGRMNVTYESDDYAYVQNRRAMQFFSIAGFGSNPNSPVNKSLYPGFGLGNDYPCVFINVPEAVNSPAEVQRKYLDGVTQLYFKIAVKVPGDRWGKGYEFVPVYADIENYGVRGGSGTTIWIQVKPVKDNESPFVTAALQFLRLNLYSKAYPFSEPGDNLDFRTFLGTFASIAGNIDNAINGFRSTCRTKNYCNTIEDDKSFVRLNNPYYKKLGGGLRVKKVEMFDNWKKMTNQEEAKYGQTYDYSTVIKINGVSTRISSGVATYEPMVGNDENPFRVPQKLYTVKMGALAPTDYMYTEEPFAETFFPAPMVGYSKIRVQSIHKDKKSANGYDETEFYTAKDFPVIVEYTPIDNDSKKTYNPAINNFLKFDARHYVTLSQGFKVELNDMHGKVKSQSSYSQNDPDKPISYTYNYYKLKNDNAGQPALSNTVAMADSTNGNIDTAAVMGVEVELMVDVREEKSFTISGSIEVNVDFVHPWPPIILPSNIPLPSFETNQYRSIAVLKIVNKYGILDSVIHIEKGSQVTTRNMVYDAETGDVLLSQTNNEFDDPVYNFNYPAHWAYEGMGSAYKNIGTVINKVNFRRGIMKYPTTHRVPVERYFQSGDELLVYGYDKRNSTTNDPCDSTNYYSFSNQIAYTKVWAVDASKGKEEQKGIYFIDRDGIPYSANAEQVRIIRSGKRNMPGVAVGSITSLATPVQKVNNGYKFVFDTATHVIAANAARFKDLWKVDSTTYAKDTTILVRRQVTEQSFVFEPEANFTLHKMVLDVNAQGTYYPVRKPALFQSSSVVTRTTGFPSLPIQWEKMSWLRFNLSMIPQGAIVKSATISLYGSSDTLQSNTRNNNTCYLERPYGQWPANVSDNDQAAMKQHWEGTGVGIIDNVTGIVLPNTTPGVQESRNEVDKDITAMAQAMVNTYYSSAGTVPPMIRIQLVDYSGPSDGTVSRLAYKTANSPECEISSIAKAAVPNYCKPRLTITWYSPCANGTPPTYSTDPTPGYYCTDFPLDTFLCKANINDTAVNFYRLGILGNWRLDRAYSYYSNRRQADPSALTNIRTDGEIKDFEPYWAFTNALLSPSADTGRWVWNSEMTRFNNKGYEIENHDPLDRYNTGIYGYNQTLPIAVAQNAKNREVAFDGFEDYGYQTSNCKKCLQNRHIDLTSNNPSYLVDTINHTGLYSLRVPGNNVAYGQYNVGGPGGDAELSLKEDSTMLLNTTVNGNGPGIGMYFYTISNGCHPYVEDNNPPPLYTNITSAVDYHSAIPGKTLPNNHPVICRTNDVFLSFQGYIQPRYSGTYKFWIAANNTLNMFITSNGVTRRITAGRGMEIDDAAHRNNAYETESIDLQAGELYHIHMLWDNFDAPYQATLEWECPGKQAREVVPANYLYPIWTDVAATKNATVKLDTSWCVRLKNPTAKRVVHEKFYPLQKQKVVVSAWVKQEAQCINGNYDNAELVLAFNNNNGTNLFTCKPSGNIIEGWQRIEDTLTIPETATSLTIYLKSTSPAPVYFDDVRIVPFNGNMKSFVYNPINLRLMAELDENNYATFYEYDDEGTLIRLKKETERGIKTIKETRSAMQRE